MSFDTNHELIIQPRMGGVKLIKQTGELSRGLLSLGSLYDMSLIYFVKFDATFVYSNHFTHLINITGNQGYYHE